MTQEALRARALEYLRARHVMTLATHGSEGPWAAAVFYVNDGFTLYYLSGPRSRHSLNIAGHPQVAAAIQEDYTDWPQIKGVQLEGFASEISGDQERAARKLYGGKYPVVGMLGKAPAAIVAAMTKVRWYRLEPKRLHFIDNAIAFGHREEVILR